MEIRKSNKNFKDGRLKCFNYKIYKHMAKDCKKPKMSRSLTMNFIFIFSFHFILFLFLFLEQLRLGFISHTVTS